MCLSQVFFLPVPSSWSSPPVKKAGGEGQRWWRTWVGHGWAVWEGTRAPGPLLAPPNPAPPTWVPRELLQPMYLTLLSSTGNSKCTYACSVVPNSYGPHELGPSRLLSWDFPVKNTGSCYHLLFLGIFLSQGLNLHLLGVLHWLVVTALPGKPEIQNIWHSS